MTEHPHPREGLLHGPHPADWDNTTTIYGPSGNVVTGHTDGWLWATDSSTLCGVRDGGEDDPAEPPIASKVVGYLSADLPAPLWAVDPLDFGKIGGVGRLRDWGVWDLSRVRDAAAWLAGDSLDRLVVAVDRTLTALRMVSPTGRVAVVMGVRTDDVTWFPTIDLPVQDAVTEYVKAATR